MAHTKDALERLDRMFTEKKLCLLSGPTGSGRHALYKYWLEGRWANKLRPKEKVSLDDVLYIRMGGSIFAGVKPARQLLAQLRDQLRRDARPAYIAQRRMGRSEGSLITGRDMEKSLREVNEGLRNQRKRLIVIDNAHLLDADSLNLALEWSLAFDDVTAEPRRARALLLIAYTEQSGDKNKIWNLVKANSLALATAVYPPIELSRLDDTTFPAMFVRLLQHNLGAELDRREVPAVREIKQLEFIDDLRQFTGGDWTKVRHVIESLNKNLGLAETGRKRVLTDKVIAAVRSDLAVLAQAGLGDSIEDKS